MVAPGEPLWLPEDRAKLHALWAWRREHCQHCHTRRADYYDDDGNELRDLPFEIRTVHCPGCELLEDQVADRPKGTERRRGEHPYLARVDVDDGPLHPEEEPSSA